MLHLRLLGFLFLALAIVALVVPLMPATPLLILAAACFARSSEKWHQRLLNNPTFGPMIRHWEEHRCITWRVKLVALLSMLALGSISVFVAIQHPGIKLFGLLMIALGCLALMRIPTCGPKQ